MASKGGRAETHSLVLGGPEVSRMQKKEQIDIMFLPAPSNRSPPATFESAKATKAKVLVSTIGLIGLDHALGVPSLIISSHPVRHFVDSRPHWIPFQVAASTV